MNGVEKKLFGSKNFLQFALNSGNQLAERQCGLKNGTLKNGTKVELWDSGVLYFQPVNYQQADSILLSAGVHGNETAPIEIVELLVKDIFSGSIQVKQNLLVVLASPLAIKCEQRFIAENMNRLFRPDLVVTERDNDERQRASQLMAYSQRFFELGGGDKWHYDMHTAIRDSRYKKFAVSPNPFDHTKTQASFSFLKRCGIEAILTTEKRSATYSAFTSRHCSATSFTLELGKVKPFGENNLADFVDINQCLTSIISGQDIDPGQRARPEYPELFSVSHELLKQTDNFRLCFPDNTANFTEFEINDVLATDTGYQYQVTESGERILFPNADVAIGQRALVIIKPVELPTTSSK